jgi:Fe2+ transport system protein FeoA
MENLDVKPLSMLQPGRSARVVTVAGGNEFQQRLVSMGLIIGSDVRIVTNSDAAGPTLVA